MDKSLTIEERIKKAEEIYNRRRNTNLNISNNISEEKNKISLSLFKKMILQIMACLVIYSAFYVIKKQNYIFSDAVMTKTSEILKYDINFTNVYNSSVKYIQDNIDKFNLKFNENENNVSEENKVDEQTGSEQNNMIDNDKKETEKELKKEKEENNTNISKAIGGGENKKNEEKKIEKSEEKTQMELDAEYVKSNMNLIKPVNGVVTSRFR